MNSKQKVWKQATARPTCRKLDGAPQAYTDQLQACCCLGCIRIQFLSPSHWHSSRSSILWCSLSPRSRRVTLPPSAVAGLRQVFMSGASGALGLHQRHIHHLHGALYFYLTVSIFVNDVHLLRLAWRSHLCNTACCGLLCTYGRALQSWLDMPGSNADLENHWAHILSVAPILTAPLNNTEAGSTPLALSCCHCAARLYLGQCTPAQ